MTTKTPDISELVSQVVAEKKASEVDLLDVPGELMPGRQALKNSSLQKYQELFGVLRSVISTHSGGIFAAGPGAQKFADIAEDAVPALVLDATELYSEIAKVWHPTVRIDHIFAVDCLPAFMMGLNSMLFPLGVRRIAAPDFGQRFGTPVKSFEDAVNLTREIVRMTVGDDLNGLYLTHRLAEKAVAEDWELKFITVVVVNATESEATGELGAHLFPNRAIFISPPENCDENAVLIACKHLRAKVSGKTSPTPNDENENSPESSPSDTKPTTTRKPRKSTNSQ
jgi:hypothetical protein